MRYRVKSERVIEVNSIKITFDFPIKTILDFDNCIVILLTLQKKNELKKQVSNLLAISNKGELLWQISNKYINEIKKIAHKTSLIILDNVLKKEIYNRFDLLIPLDKWNFYLNPETGKKIRDEQVEK